MPQSPNQDNIQAETDYFSDRDKANKPQIDDKLMNKIKKNKLGKIGNVVVWEINDELIRNCVDLDFVMAGNFARDDYVPLNEIWISQLLPPSDYAPTLVHEFIESYLMKNHNQNYEDAHDFANIFEKKFRTRLTNKELKIKNNKDAFKEANRIVKEFLADSITKFNLLRPNLKTQSKTL